MISIIAVVGKNREIGYKNKLLWDLPPDLKHFKKITEGHTVMMGENTFHSLGRPLPNRANVILTKNQDFKPASCRIAHSIEEGIALAKKEEKKLALATSKTEEIFIIGGGQIYKQFLPLADKLYLTLVDDSPEADTFFPDYSEFSRVIKEEGNEYNSIKFKYVELIR